MVNSLTSANRSALFVVPLVTWICALGCSPRTPPPEAHSPDSTDLVGAWRAKLQFNDGAFAPIKNLEFMYVFNAGGTMTESSNYDGAPPVPPAYGVWREVGPQEYEAKYAFYITLPPKKFEEITGGTGWLPNGHGVFLERLRLAPDGKSFESSITYSAFDSLGAPTTGGGTATGRGVRIAF